MSRIRLRVCYNKISIFTPCSTYILKGDHNLGYSVGSDRHLCRPLLSIERSSGGIKAGMQSIEIDGFLDPCQS